MNASQQLLAAIKLAAQIGLNEASAHTGIPVDKIKNEIESRHSEVWTVEGDHVVVITHTHFYD